MAGVAHRSNQVPFVDGPILQIPVVDIKPYAGNPRVHPDAQIRKIARSIEQFGFVLPILVDADNVVVAGHARLLAAEWLELKTVPTLCVSHLTEAQIRAYRIADNKLAEEADWDRAKLAIEFDYLVELDSDLDLTLTGFSLPEIDLVIQNESEPDEVGEEPPVEVPDDASPSITKRGDLWMLGQHRLLCGDALCLTDYHRLLGKRRAQMVFTDPPYNVRIAGNVGGLGATQHDEFVMASGEMTPEEYTGFLATVFENLVAHSTDGSLHFVCMDWRHLQEILAAGKDAYSELKNFIVWAKTNAGMGSLYRSQHELVLLFKYGNAKHINNVELGCHGRHRSNVWTYPGVNTFRAGRDEDIAVHPTVKPLAMVADAILDCSRRGGLILDPFVGSGTTILAAQQTGRIAYGMDMDAKYVDVAIRRWQTATGEDAVLDGTDQTFTAVAAQRSAAA
ncbi:MAG: site-specific DNA-methyltransferase [Magnetospiraceae bacterium]